MIVFVPLEDGRTEEIELDRKAATTAADLTGTLADYFLIDTGFELALADVVNSRVRPDGVANAIQYMAQAARGEIPRRPPVSVERVAGERWRIIDGNSTVVAARAAGWTTIWALEREDAAA